MMRGVVIAGTGSGVGKTAIATGLMRKLSRRKTVQGFKVGPDFIDPIYHRSATQRYSRNLDSFMMPKKTVRDVAIYGSRGADISIVEGVRGLYEGASGKNETGSTAEIAKILGFPVVLVLDSTSLSRSAAAIVNGFKAYDREIDIAGVILNNVSGSQHETKLKDAMKSADINVLGMVRKDPESKIPLRRLGLNTEAAFNKEKMDRVEGMADSIDTDQLMDICYGPDTDEERSPYKIRDSGLTAAIPMDDAFCFYYRENIECLAASGIKIEYFSPLKGDPLPDADIYYIGGGHPELHLEKLSENRDFYQGLKTAHEDNKVIIGECGGTISLCRSIRSGDKVYKAAGIFSAEFDTPGERSGPSYVVARPTKECGLFDKVVRGHVYYYSTMNLGSESRFGFDVLRGTSLWLGKDGLVSKNTLGTCMYQHALSTEDWAEKIVERCE
ncbi:MAG: hydrogenobyrinic acid a,c-diamide synthase (glutamine-hydrolyzing) [Candidatus Methanoplasma sp.]|jgi:cobyrinic acid a,c-diamide synthase|nr:hydrogenobyrinic acid a,c-diamide synthase (glutamine-hydrolyzing) [Candidatus Methanoplasma sp.]